MARTMRRGATAKRRSSGPAVFPSRLKATGRQITDANNVPMATMRGFNIHAIAGFAQSHFDDIAALGGTFLRIICRWDNFEPTSGTVATGPRDGLDTTVTRAAAAGLYCMIDFHLMAGAYPVWAQTTTTPEGDYQANGQFLTQYLANRYGNPASPQYAVNMVGMGLNELPVSDAAVRNGNNAIPFLEGIQRTMVTWMRVSAPSWIGFVCYGWANQTPLRVTGYNASMTEADPAAYNSVGGNVVVDLHDYMMGDTRTTPPYDGRQFNGMLYPASQGGPEYGSGDLPAYVPAVLTRAQLVAYVKPYKDFSISAGIPIMLGEWGWPLETGAGYTAGEQAYIDDKQAAWDDAGFAIRVQWNYDVTADYGINPYTSRPGATWRPSVVDEVGLAGGVVTRDDFANGPTGAIASHTAVDGTGYVSLAGFTGLQLSATGRVYSNSAEAWAYSNVDPDTVEYEVRAKITVASTAQSLIGVAVGMSASARTAYVLTYEAPSGDIEWWRIVAGVATRLGVLPLGTPIIGDDLHLTLQRTSDGWIGPFVDNYLMTESPWLQDTTITALGHPGLYALGSVSATTGLQIEDFEVGNVVLDG